MVIKYTENNHDYEYTFDKKSIESILIESSINTKDSDYKIRLAMKSTDSIWFLTNNEETFIKIKEQLVNGINNEFKNGLH